VDARGGHLWPYIGGGAPETLGSAIASRGRSAVLPPAKGGRGGRCVCACGGGGRGICQCVLTLPTLAGRPARQRMDFQTACGWKALPSPRTTTPSPPIPTPKGPPIHSNTSSHWHTTFTPQTPLGDPTPGMLGHPQWTQSLCSHRLERIHSSSRCGLLLDPLGGLVSRF
jgi:hypothetical protein